MRNLALILLLTFVLQSRGFSQDCPGDWLVFSSQQQLDNFHTQYPNCTSIEGTLHIYGDNITNLDSLYFLVNVGGDLLIESTNISNIDGLNNITGVVEWIKITFNPNLSNINGLINLTSIVDKLTIRNNNLLGDITGLENFTSVGDQIDISYNNSLASLAGLENINPESISELIIEENPLLSNCEVVSVCGFLASPNGLVSIQNNAFGCNSEVEVINACASPGPCLPEGIVFTSQDQVDGFYSDYSACTIVGGNVKIEGNDITNLIGLSFITEIQGDLIISNNSILNGLNGLDNIQSIGGNLEVVNNEIIEDITDLENISAVSIIDLTITGNSQLSFCRILNLCEYFGNPNGTIEISNNMFECNSQQEIEVACNRSCLLEGISFDSQIEIDNFQVNYSGCTDILGDVNIAGADILNLDGLVVVKVVEGDMTIGGYDQINSLLPSLSGLNNLTSIQEDFIVQNNALFTNLSGLENLSVVGKGFIISANEEMASLSGLDNLTYVGGEFDIIESESLIDITALSNLDSVGQGLALFECNSLTNLNGLENLTTISGGGFGIVDNSALVDISALENLMNFNGGIYIWFNSSLTNLTGLENVNSINGELSIWSNSSLTNLTGLVNVISINGELSIRTNEALTNIEGVGNIDGESITDLRITDNPLLSICNVQSICEYLSIPENIAVIYGNAFGCSYMEQVANNCLLGLSNIKLIPNLTVYPNPATNQVYISTENAVTVESLNIYNQLGQIVFSQIQFSNPVNVSALKPGVYIIEIVTDNIITRERLIIE